MKSPADRLKEARRAAGYTDPIDAARAMGVNPVTYYSHENGTRGLARSARKYAEFFRVSLDWLVTGKGSISPRRRLNILGYAGAGAAIYPENDGSTGYAMDTIDSPITVSRDAAGVIVRGDSMYPAFEDGDVLVYDDADGDPKRLVGKRVIVKLADGRMFVKRIRRGSKSDVYTLESTNAPPIEDVAIDWAAPIIAVIMRN